MLSARRIAFQINLHIYLDVEEVAGMLDQKANENGFILKESIWGANIWILLMQIYGNCCVRYIYFNKMFEISVHVLNIFIVLFVYTYSKNS